MFDAHKDTCAPGQGMSDDTYVHGGRQLKAGGPMDIPSFAKQRAVLIANC